MRRLQPGGLRPHNTRSNVAEPSPINPPETSLYKKLFARSLAKGDLYQDRIYGNRKEDLFSGIHGDVLEIGAGTGVNLVYLPDQTTWTGIDPNPYMHRFVYDKAKDLDMEVNLCHGYAEQLPFDDNRFDAVISTLVLCSVSSIETSLQEIHRVLKPGGALYFIEHVIAPEGTLLRRFQRILKPAWKLVADGCMPDRDTGRLIQSAGFSSVDITPFAISLPINLIRPHIMGKAIK